MRCDSLNYSITKEGVERNSKKFLPYESKSNKMGVTFASESDDAFTLLPAVASTMRDAQVRGSQMVMRSVMGYAAAQRSVGTKAAFIQSTKSLVQNMLKSMAKKLEIQLMYGQAGLGEVSAASAAPNTITIEETEWAPGIWGGSENMPIEIYDATGVTLRDDFVITAVDFETRTLTLNANPVAAGVIATDVIYFLGAKGNEMAGLHAILSNTGTLFNINAAQFSLWKSSVYDAAGPLSFNKIQEAIARGVEKGLDSDVTVLVNPDSWAVLLTEQAALRMYDSSFSKEQAENGSKSIKFHGQNGIIEIVPSIYVKRGYAYVVSVDEMSRIGSTDITFKRPGREGEFFRELENAAGYELRAYTDQALFCYAPAKNILIEGITA
jgi:hypothetical protein